MCEVVLSAKEKKLLRKGSLSKGHRIRTTHSRKDSVQLARVQTKDMQRYMMEFMEL